MTTTREVPALTVHVDVDNSTRAESDRMFASFQADAGGVNRLSTIEPRRRSTTSL